MTSTEHDASIREKVGDFVRVLTSEKLEKIAASGILTPEQAVAFVMVLRAYIERVDDEASHMVSLGVSRGLEPNVSEEGSP